MMARWIQAILGCAYLLLATGQGWAAIALVQSATQVDVAGSSTTAPSITLNGVTAGNYLVLVGHIGDHATDAFTITNTTDGTNTYTTRSAVQTDVGVQRIYAVIAFAKVASSGNYTVAVNLASTSAGAGREYTLGLQEWSGIVATTPEDTWDPNDNIDSSGSVDASAGPITTTDAGDLLIGVAALDANDPTANFSSPASWTNAYRQNDATTYYGSDSAYWLPGSIQTGYTAQWSHDNGVARSAGVIVALKPAIPTVVGCRLLQDGTSKRLLQDGSSGRIFQGGGSGCGGSAPPTVVPVRTLMGVGS